MGNSYTNILLFGPGQDEVISALKDMHCRAYVSPTVDRKTVVYEQTSDELDLDRLGSIAYSLICRLGGTALTALIFDDDELYLQLFEGEKQTVNYVSRGGSRGGAWRLCRVFGRRFLFPLLWLAMNFPFVLFEYWRHAIICRLLALPDWGVATGYRYIRQGEYPIGLSEDDLFHVIS